MGNRPLLQGIFPTQESNPGIPHCGWILYQLSHKDEDGAKNRADQAAGLLPAWRLLLQGHRRSADSHSFTPAFMWTPHTHLKKTHGETHLRALISDS